jgi:hypothetical protein
LSPLTIAGLAFACILGSALLGLFVGRALPGHHLSGESKDAVKLGLALIATLTALVLGLLVASAKGTYDTQNSAIQQMSADVLLLDRVLTRYGPETKDAQELLRRGVTLLLDSLWPADSTRTANLVPGAARAELEAFYDKVADLAPKNNAQRTLQARALEITTDLGKTRLRLFAQRNSAIPVPFLSVLVFWLVILFAGYGLMAPRNATVVAVLIVCILSVSAALFLILELDRPFEGLLRISSAPMRDALTQLGQ